MVTKERLINDVEAMKKERFQRCDELNVLNGQLAYAEHLLKQWDVVEPITPAVEAPAPESPVGP